MIRTAFALSKEQFKDLVSGKMVLLTASEDGQPVSMTSISLQNIQHCEMLDMVKEALDEHYGV